MLPDASPLVIVGFGAVGAMNGAVAGAHRRGRHSPPERRARAISYVLFGALFGAALGPLVFRPLFAGKDLELDALVVPWLVAAAMALGGVIVALLIRPDPRTIALELERVADPATPPAPAAPLRRSCAGRAFPRP